MKYKRVVLYISINLIIVYLVLRVVEYLMPRLVGSYLNIDFLAYLDYLLYAVIVFSLLSLALYFPYRWAAHKVKSLRVRWLPPTLRPIFGWAAARLGSLRARIDIYNTVKKGISIIFLALLVFLFLHAIFDWDFLKDNQIALIVATIAIGALALLLNRDKIDLQAETKEEELGEAERRKEFVGKFPKINRIPVVRWLIRWMYQEGWKYSIGLIVIVILGLVLRIWDLGNLNILVEEQFHYSPAKNLIQEGTPKMFYTSAEYFGYINYYRTSLYTLITAGIFKIFGVSEFNLRIFSVLLSLLTGIIIYLLSKEILNKKFALISFGLFMFSSWAIWYARWARHYVFDAFLLILFVWISFLVCFKKRSKYLFLIPLLLIPWVEVGNYIYLLIIAILLLFIIILKKELIIFLKDKSIIIILSLTLLNFFIYGQLNQNYYITEPLNNIAPEIEYSFVILINAFFNNLLPLEFNSYFLKLMWDFYPSLILLATLSFFAILLNFKKKQLLLLLSFPLMLLVLLFYDPGRTWEVSQYWIWEPRHFSFLIPLYLLFSSIGLYYLLKLFNNKIKIILLVLMFLTIFSTQPYKITYGDDISGTPYQVMTSEAFYSNIKSPILYIQKNFNDDTDLLIFDTMEVMYRAYWDKEPNKRIGWDRDGSETIAQSNATNIIPDNPEILKDYILRNVAQGKRVWLIEASYNDLNHHSRVRKGKIRRFLEKEGATYIVYSKDYTNIYLFTNEYFKNNIKFNIELLSNVVVIPSCEVRSVYYLSGARATRLECTVIVAPFVSHYR